MKIFSTPDAWGNQTEYHNRKSMEQTIDSLRDVGIEADISECGRWDLIKDLGSQQAVYELTQTRRRDVRVFTPHDDGSYTEDYIVTGDDFDELGIK